MSDIQIIRGVACPPKTRSGGRRCLYPWDVMEVTDHFVFPKRIKKTTATSLAYRAKQVTGKTFAIRVQEDGIKCWRTA